MAKKLRVWKPLDSIGGTYWFENMSLLNENFVFVYRKPQERHIKVHVICGGSIPSFRYTNETYESNQIFLNSTEEMQSLRPWCFYTVEDSEYLKKLSEDSGGISDFEEVKHYCIISFDEIVDLAYPIEPVVELVIDGKVVESSDPEHRSLQG